MEEHMYYLCSYCNEKPARYYFKSAKKWCCSKHFSQCPVMRKERSDFIRNNENLQKHYHNRKTEKRIEMEKDIEAGKLKCVYCGETAYHLLPGYRACCVPLGRDCPKFNTWLGNRFKRYYKENPERVEQMREISKEIHNRPEVIEKKQEKMLNLHHGDCEPCVEFQCNYAKGRQTFQDVVYKRYIKFLMDLGFKKKELPTEKSELKILVRRAKYYIKKDKKEARKQCQILIDEKVGM